MTLEWFRVAASPYPSTEVICRDCLTKHHPPLLNRVFGASQTCAICGATDRKPTNDEAVQQIINEETK